MPDDWWRHAVIYEVYPRSFQDSNGDGVGDLDGIRRRLDYLKWLGVDAIWLAPFFPSPMHDFGYDVADHCNVDPVFGSLASFDHMLREAHQSGLKIIIDFVPNHTSSAHPWFRESARSRDNEKRDWYIWLDPAPDGGPPNNWLSHFGGGAWTWHEETGQYYHHAYLSQQPDLNWRNPHVREAMHEVLRFWLRRGVDGFRVDVMWHLAKDPTFRDNPPNPEWTDRDPEIERLLPIYSADRPEVHEIIAGLRRVLEEFGDRLLIGEIYLPLEKLLAYYGEGLSGAHLPFNFLLLNATWSASNIAAIVKSYEAALPAGAAPNWVLGNHDRRRIAARIGEPQARVAAMLLLTLRGVPTLYYGDELGLAHVDIPPDQIRDPWARREPLIGVGRDPCRTPMQWDASPFAGFSTHNPWLPVTPDYQTRNVGLMRRDDGSILSLYRRLLQYRRERVSLSAGDWSLLEQGREILVYERRTGSERTLVALNFSTDTAQWRGPAGRIVVTTFGDRQGESVDEILRLRPNEGVILEPVESALSVCHIRDA